MAKLAEHRHHFCIFQAAWARDGQLSCQYLLQTACQGKIEWNCFYLADLQFLTLCVTSQKFQMFTYFLADDNAKSLLSREFRWFENQKGEGNTIYPFDRASAFAKEIKKLEAESGNNGLDECRVIVSEIGNVIALVRMIRAAKRRVFSDEMQFLPCYNIPGTVKSLNEGRTNDAKSSIDNAVSDILNKPDPDFVRAFVGVFRGVIQKSESENAFMGNFFCIVPALCLCWMEASIQGKEMMHKKNITRDGYYTDDGFAVGLAFALSVLGQTKTYERYVELLNDIRRFCHYDNVFSSLCINALAFYHLCFF